MLKICADATALKIIRGDKEIFQISQGMKCLELGFGTAKYTMNHGTFSFREKTSVREQLLIGEICESGNGALLRLCNEAQEEKMTVVLSTSGDRLDIHFEPKEKNCNRLWLTLPAMPSEHVYGGGEVFSEWDLRGKKLRVWVAEHNNGVAVAKKLARVKLFGADAHHKEPLGSYETYYAQPTFVSSRCWFFHSDAVSFCEFDFRAKHAHRVLMREIADVHIGFADSFLLLAEELSRLLGTQPELPDWAYDGAILGIQGGTQTVLDKLEAVKKYNTAVAGVWCQDWEGRRITAFGKQLMWNWKWDSELYPSLDVEIRRLKERGIRFLGYINPFLAVEKELYKYASEKGYCVKDKKGRDYLVTITTFPAAMVDLTNPQAYAWLKSVIKENMLDFGLDGWMADFGEYLPTDSVLFSGENPELVHCTWPARWAQLNREVIEENGRLGDVFFFTRAGHTGSIKSSTLMWNGDQHTDWSYDWGLPSVIPATLSLAVCGFGLCHSDMGGYITQPPIRRSKELFMRWVEMCAFSLLMRSHEGNRPDSNVQFDSDESILVHHAKFSRIHAALKPYLKASVKNCCEHGIPVIMPMFYCYDEEKAYTDSTQYMLGTDMLVAPVLEQGEVSRSVYLPDDEWTELWDNREYSGGICEVSAPIGFPPVFYRSKSEFSQLFKTIKEI